MLIVASHRKGWACGILFLECTSFQVSYAQVQLGSHSLTMTKTGQLAITIAAIHDQTPCLVLLYLHMFCRGLSTCMGHCILFLAMGSNLPFMLVVFISHFVLDVRFNKSYRDYALLMHYFSFIIAIACYVLMLWSSLVTNLPFVPT